MTQPSIVTLRDHPDALDTVAGWIDREWGSFSGRTLQQTRERFAQELSRPLLPNSCVALAGVRPLGVATLRARDSVDWDPTATPWICNVYVAEEARGKAVAAGLCQALEDIARRLGYRHIHLATVMAEGSLYHRLGFIRYRTYDALEHPMYLMRRPLGE